ncbi:unnamed protein product (macronuclear) [Paramecium tetraurelia]|uniref:RING-type domain-containing protein n=1 Tax=Paramecium tetraurelia TaxID=5888 RepID=A0DA18_PARTE|nr:uncharacterized protein GSPATT00014817001 [Paramecium tetraurelia]CAK79885.1 unnamed protein product [Paramecium tetraurelia]|eukprot:XP_001447282.1 hypothetical protein (macronuclear) [Paramecium tetraurelia strain d4-2]
MNEQFLNCRLCSIEFDLVIHLPRLLNECGHTVCEKCIKQQEGHFRCPADETLYEYSIDGFPINTTLFKLIQLKQKPKLNDLFETPQLSLYKNNSSSDSTISKNKFQDSQLTPISLQNTISESQKQRDEILSKIENKFNDLITRLEVRKMELFSQIDMKYEQSPFCLLQIDFQFQMDVLVPRYGILREEVYNDIQLSNSQQKEQFLTFSNKDSIDTNRQRSPQKKIFEELKQIQIRPALSQEKMNELKKIIKAMNRSENLETINLKARTLTDDDIKIFSEALSRTISNIRALVLSRNEITDQGFQYLIDALWTNNTIKILKLKNNKLTNESLKYLIEIYEDQKYNSLQQIYMQGNQINNDDQVQALTKLGLLIYI